MAPGASGQGYNGFQALCSASKSVQNRRIADFCYYDVQRFTQFGSMDCANWYGIAVDDSKNKQAMYPAMGRKHVRFLNSNKLIFASEPRFVFKTINYTYVIVGTQVIQIDRFFESACYWQCQFDWQ